MKKKINSQRKHLTDKLPLEKFIPSAFMLFLLLFIILTVIIYNSINHYRESLVSVDHTNDVLNTIDDITLILTQMQLDRRGYLVKDDNKYLADYYSKKISVAEKFTRLKEIVNNDSEQTNLVSRMDSLASGSISMLDTSISVYDRDKNIDREFQSNVATASQDYLDQLFITANDLKDEEINQLNISQGSANKNLSDTQTFIVGTSLIVFVALGLSLIISSRLLRNKNFAEKLLKKSYDELEEKVEERTAELKYSNENQEIEIRNRIKIEKSLRESEERFRLMADSAPVLIWMSDTDKLCNYFNKGWLDFTGRTLEQELGNGWAEGVHPDDFKKCLDVYNTAFDRREQFEMEYRLRTASGDFRWIFDIGLPRYEGSEFVGYIGTCIDINSKKKAERYLRIQYSVSKSLAEAKSVKESLVKVLESLCSELDWGMGVVWMVKGEKLTFGAMWSGNEKFLKQYSQIHDENYTFEKGIGLPGRVWKYNKSYWVQNIEEDSNFPRKTAMLELGWRSALGIPVTEDNKVIAVVECFNKTMLTPKEDLLEVLENTGRQIGNFLERKKIEEKLRISYNELDDRVKDKTLELANTLNRLLNEIEEKEKVQNKLKLFAHAVKDVKECIFITDLQNRTIFVNSAFENTYGYFEEELLDKQIPVLFSPIVNEQTRDIILTDSVRGGWRGELKSKTKNGSEFYINLSTTVIRNDEGKVQAIVGICQDISESKNQKALLEKKNSLLKLLNNVIAVVNKSFNLEESIAYAINQLCGYTTWDIGHCFLVKNDKLVSSNIWNQNLSSQYEEFKKLSEESAFSIGEGMAGKSLKTGEAYWVKTETLLDQSSCKRSSAINHVGLKTGIWVPIKKGSNVLGLLEFFNKDELPQDNEILDCITNIGFEIGSLYERNEFIELIKEREKHFKAVADTANEAIITADSESRIIYTNQSVEAIFGYSSEELVGEKLSILMPDDLIQRHARSFDSVVKTGHSLLLGETIELRGRHKNNSEFPLELSIARWEMNDRVYFTGMIRDISLRKQIENELLESRNSLLEAQKIAKLGSWEWDAVGDNVSWSDEMYNIFEMEPGTEITNDSYLEMLGEPNRNARSEAVSKALESGLPFSYYLNITTRSGASKILNSIGKVETGPDGKITRMVGTIIDVTDIKTAEEKIKVSEKQLKEAQKIAKLGSWETSLVTGKTEWSEEMYRIFEVNENFNMEDFDTFKSLIYIEDVEKTEQAALLLSEKPVDMELDFRIVTEAGKLKYLTNDIRVEFDDRNRPVRVFGSTQDITDIKLAEEELKRTNARLIEAQKELVHNEKLAALGRFSSGIAHEIRNPLANISALAQLISKSKNGDEKLKKHLRYILINSDIANNIIKQLLHFASPEDLVFSEENLVEIIDNILNSVEPRCTESKIILSRQIRIDPSNLMVDKTRLENSLLNFISNSIDAMQDGGSLAVNAQRDNIKNEVTIDIIDTGHGIPAENLDKIFEPFFTTKEAGTGLGLGLAYQTVKLHNGTLNISSEPGKGTHVKIKIPVRIIINGKDTNN